MLAEYDSLLDDLVIDSRQAEPQRRRLVVNVSYYAAQVLASLSSKLDILSACILVEKPFRQILEEARMSDCSELYLVDLYEDTFRDVNADRSLMFVPIAKTQFGIVWQDGSPLAGKDVLHRADIAKFPLAVDSHREMLRYAEYVYEGHPLSNIQRGVANPRATLAYALTSPEVASTFDSFGFEVARATSALDMSSLNFTPLATPRAQGWFGFVLPSAGKPHARERRFIGALSEGLDATFPDYYKQYPLA